MTHLNPLHRPSQLSFAVRDIQRRGGLQLGRGIDLSRLSSTIKETQGEYRERVYPPDLTLFASMHQALSEDKSLRNAVARMNADRIAKGLKPASSNTAAYAAARKKLPESLPKILAKEIAEDANAQALNFYSQKLGQGRPIKVVDGSTLIMADTPENQAAFPQMKSQKEGAGFPIMRIVGVFSILTGCILDLATAQYSGKETGEHSLFRKLLHCFDKNDILLGDAYYGSYFLMALLQHMGIDFVFEAHASRSIDFRCGIKLGEKDHLRILQKPRKPEWMSEEEYKGYPETITIREFQITLSANGYRPKKLNLISSFKDSKTSTKALLGDLYQLRWKVELDFRAIKTTMNMDMLRSKTPEMAHKEIWIHLLAYNAIRQIILEAAIKNGIMPYLLSFKATMQTFSHYSTLWRIPKLNMGYVYECLLEAIAKHKIGNRPGRREPRKRKRRQKPFPLLQKRRNSILNRQALESMKTNLNIKDLLEKRIMMSA